MSLFDNLGGLLSNAIKSHPGGLSGLLSTAFTDIGGMDTVIAKLNDAGLGSKVNSWLGKGDNMPITADEIRSALSNEYLQGMAQKLGVPVDQVANLLAEHLPAAVDTASPEGTIKAS